MHDLHLPFQLDDDDEQIACIKRDLSNQKRMLTDSIRVSILSKHFFFILIGDMWEADVQAFPAITSEISTDSQVNFITEFSFIKIAGPELRFRGYFMKSSEHLYFWKLHSFADVLQLGVLKNFANFTGKHLCWSVFSINKFKEISTLVFSCEIWNIFKNTFFAEHLWWLLIEISYFSLISCLQCA